MKTYNIFSKKIVLSILGIFIVLIAVSCSPKTVQTGNKINNNNNDQRNELPSEVTDVIKQTTFDQDILYLNEKGIELQEMDSR